MNQDEQDTLTTIIPYHNKPALIGYYFGVFAFIPVLGLLLAPVALILGIMGYQYNQKNKASKGMGHAIFAMVAGSVLTLLQFGCLIWFVTMATFA